MEAEQESSLIAPGGMNPIGRVKRRVAPGGLVPHTLDAGPKLSRDQTDVGPSALPMKPPTNPLINPLPSEPDQISTGYQNSAPKVAPAGPSVNPMPWQTASGGGKGDPMGPTGFVPGKPNTNPIPGYTGTQARTQPPTQTFRPGNDLRSTQFNPTPSARLTGAQGATGQAAQGVQNFNRGSTVQGYTDKFNQQLAQKPVGFTPVGTAAQTRSVNPNVAYERAGTDVNWRGVDTNVNARDLDYNVKAGPEVMPTDTERFLRLGGQQDSAVNTLTTGPNRTQIAKNTLADFNEQLNLSRQTGIRDIGKAAAKFGRIGAGMTTNDLTGLEGTLDRQRRAQENALAASVAEGDINDRFRTVDTVSGLRGQEENIYSNRRGEQRTERDYRTGLDERNVGRGFADRDYRTGLDERNVGRSQQERDAQIQLEQQNLERQRAERDFKTGLGERNYGRDYGQAQDETGLQERNLGRQFDERNAGLGLDERNAGRDFDSRRSALEAAMGMGNAEGNDALNRFKTASDAEGDIYGQEFDARNEQRGERGYQEEAARYAGDQQVRQREMENQEMDAEFRRAAIRSGIGMSGSQQQSGQADGANDLLMDWLRRQQAQTATPPTVAR